MGSLFVTLCNKNLIFREAILREQINTISHRSIFLPIFGKFDSKNRSCFFRMARKMLRIVNSNVSQYGLK